MTGNTLGCRVHSALTASSSPSPTTECAHAGPAGDVVTATPPAACSGGDLCGSFCAIEVAACGSFDAPLTGDPKDADGNSLYQFRNLAACIAKCAFDNTHPYVPTAAGDSFACRLLHAVSAGSSTANATQHCSSTAANPRNSCAGPATP